MSGSMGHRLWQSDPGGICSADWNIGKIQVQTKLCHYDWTEDGTDAPCRAETCRTFAYDFQTYILNHDGSMYNEICEFTFDDEKTGHGYYYQANRDSENE